MAKASEQQPFAPAVLRRRSRTSPYVWRGSAIGVRHAATLLGITADAVRHQCEAGEIPARRTEQGAWRIPYGYVVDAALRMRLGHEPPPASDLTHEKVLGADFDVGLAAHEVRCAIMDYDALVARVRRQMSHLHKPLPKLFVERVVDWVVDYLFTQGLLDRPSRTSGLCEFEGPDPDGWG